MQTSLFKGVAPTPFVVVFTIVSNKDVVFAVRPAIHDVVAKVF